MFLPSPEETTDPVGIAVKDKRAFEDGFNDVAQGVVYHPVAEWGCWNQAALRLVDVETAVGIGR